MASLVRASEWGQIRTEILFHWLVIPIPDHSRLLSPLVIYVGSWEYQSVSPVICHSERQGTTYPCKDTWGWHPTTSTYVSAPQTVQMSLEICLYFLVNTSFSSAFYFFFVCLFVFWPYCLACGILVPQPGINPVPPALEVWSTPAPRKVPHLHLNCLYI